MKSNTKGLVTTAVVAAIYATLTLALGFISYGPIQFRIAEVMILLPFISSKYIVGLTLGCFIANIIGPYGVPDIVIGTLATFISAYLVYLTSKLIKESKFALIVAGIWPTVVNAVMVGFMLNKFYGAPLIYAILEVGFGQFVVINIIGLPLFKILSSRYGNLLKSAF
ncbi:MAG: QueT transporter family protein [Romboutsia sp.]